MEMKFAGVMRRVNILASELDNSYHKAALKLGMADSVMLALYIIYERGGSCPLGTIKRELGMSKQTLNSAVRKLEADGTIYLEQTGGRTKTAYLTDAGREYAANTVGRLFWAETAAFDGWSEEEISEYLRLMEKYNNDFKLKIENL